jgi:hypothetical protein
MVLTDFQNELSRNIGDLNNFTFTTDQKTDALTRAFNDKYAVTVVWDNSVTFTISQYQYAIPADITVISDIYLERDVSQFPEAISRELWEVVNGNIQFNNVAHWTIPDQYPLWLKGYYKVKTTDTISDTGLQQYILALAGWNLLKTLTFTKLGSFLRNDTSIQELLASRKEMQADIAYWRQQIQIADFTAT